MWWPSPLHNYHPQLRFLSLTRVTKNIATASEAKARKRAVWENLQRRPFGLKPGDTLWPPALVEATSTAGAEDPSLGKSVLPVVSVPRDSQRTDGMGAFHRVE